MRITHPAHRAWQVAQISRQQQRYYKSGARQKEQFDKAVNRIQTKEVTEFHEGLFTLMVLLPQQGIEAWVAERRPLLWQLLGERQQEFSDGNAMGILLDLLHSPDGLPVKA